LSDGEQERLPASEADIEACRAALAARRAHVVDEALVSPEALEELKREADAAPEAEEDSGEGGPEAPETNGGPAADTDGGAADDEDGAPAGEAFFGIYLPVHLDEAPIAVLALGERARGEPYAAADLTFLRHLLSQYAVALN